MRLPNLDKNVIDIVRDIIWGTDDFETTKNRTIAKSTSPTISQLLIVVDNVRDTIDPEFEIYCNGARYSFGEMDFLSAVMLATEVDKQGHKLIRIVSNVDYTYERAMVYLFQFIVYFMSVAESRPVKAVEYILERLIDVVLESNIEAEPKHGTVIRNSLIKELLKMTQK